MYRKSCTKFRNILDYPIGLQQHGIAGGIVTARCIIYLKDGDQSPLFSRNSKHIRQEKSPPKISLFNYLCLASSGSGLELFQTLVNWNIKKNSL